LVVLPEDGPLRTDLDGVEVIIRPLSVLRRGLLNPRGLASLSAAAVRDAVALRELIRDRDVAIVHSNTSVVLGGAAAARLARVPHVWHVREIYSRFGRAWPPYRQLLETADALPCVSGATAAQFRSATVVNDGLASNPSRAPGGRAALGIPPDVPVIAVLGRISDWKGQDVLIRALASPKLRQRGALGLLAGDVWPGAEDRRERVLALARQLDVSDRLLLVGFRDDVDNVYGAADIVAVPSTEPDPLPGSAIEAAAAGCAVIAAAHGGLPEIIRDGETGVLVDPGDAAMLAGVAADLIDDPARRARLGAAAAADVRERFAPERLLDAIQTLYDGL
jgi:glycosyltransferase involved in cell wall biosynthesis